MVNVDTSPPNDVTAVQAGPTSIDVSWTPPTPLGDTTGYIIYYTNDDSDSVDIDSGSTDEYTLTGLQNGDTYTISIVATSSSGPPSESVLTAVGLGKSVINNTYILIFFTYSSSSNNSLCIFSDDHIYHNIF